MKHGFGVVFSHVNTMVRSQFKKVRYNDASNATRVRRAEDRPLLRQHSVHLSVQVDSVQWMSYSEVCTMVMEQSHTVCPDSLTMFKAYMESRGQS